MKRNSIGSRWAWLLVLVLGGALTPETGRAAPAVTGDITFNGAKISVVNAQTNWVNGDLLLVFTNPVSRTGSFKLPGLAKARILAIGGGGAGGSIGPADNEKNGGAGGGGAGGFVQLAETKYAAGTYSVSIGAGGQNPSFADVATQGAKGGETTVLFGSTTIARALGGGGGGAEGNGGDGASGGGGSLRFVGGKTYAQGFGGTGSQGNNGGSTAAKAPSGYGAGGGGAGAEAVEANTTSNPGGDGLPSDITGTSLYYAGGGGGGCAYSTGKTDHPGGLGGGGAGGVSNLSAYKAQKGVDGLGGGGGGGGYSTFNVGGNGGCGGVYVRFSSVLPGPVVPPASTNLVYDGKDHVFVPDSIAYTVTGGVKVGRDVGTYTATLTPGDGIEWEDGQPDPTGPRTVTLTITAAQSFINGLALKGWMKGTPVKETPNPTVTDLGLHAAGEPTYAYGPASGDAFSSEKPTEPGDYTVRASIADTANYLGAVAFAKFSIWNDPGVVFTDYVEITIPAYAGPGELLNFPYKVTLAEGNPLGFSYDRAGLSGETLCVREGAADAGGGLLAYEADWNPKGESVLYVKVPRIGATAQKITLYWHASDPSGVPTYDASTVWSDWPDRTAYDKIKQPTPALGDVVKEGKIVNRWVTLPAVDKTEWNADEPPAKLMTTGVLAHGTVVSNIVNSLTGETLTDWPSGVGGVYRITFSAAESDLYETEPYHIDLRIVEHLPTDNLQGGAASLTLSGRVLLANDDSVAGHEITDQGYWQESSVRHGKTTDYYEVFWEHIGDHTKPYALPYLFTGSSHILCQTNFVDGVALTNVLWRLEDVLIGNTIPSDQTMSTRKCFLPFSATSKMISTYGNRTKAATKIEQGNLVMRNVVGAAIYSPCYTNGIGTVYFDVVNGWRDNIDKDNPYHLVVEVATETVDGLPPTDANARGENEQGIVTDLGRIQENQWKRVDLLPLKRDEGATVFTAQALTNELELAINRGGTDKNFYRVCAKVEARGAARFRIYRTTRSPNNTEDDGSLILVDNIVVSYPRNTAEMTSFGEYDESLVAKQTLGFGGAFEPAFPSVSEPVYGRGQATVYCGALTNADPSTFIQLSRLHYRWRYLNQVVGDWQTTDLRPSDGYRAEKALEVPASAGDVEYWYETFTQMPYYRYFDYSGTGAGLLGTGGATLYSEEMAIVTNRLDLATVEGQLPGNNANWFVRLRPGRSDFERIRLLVRRGTDAEAPVEAYDLELIGDNSWRAYVPTLEAVPDGLMTRFELVNRQDRGATTYAHTVTYATLREEFVSSERPNSLVEVIDDKSWTKVACDALTGGLMFQVQDATRAVSIVHADYQDFNGWTDANKKDGLGLFVGKSEYNEAGASGTNPETKTFEDLFATWHVSNAANTNYWSEPFNVPVAQMGAGKDYEPFKPFTGTRRTPNGLTAGPGQWVTGFYRDVNTGLALQMQGQGKGFLQFVDAAEAPRGLESVSVKARLGQAIGFNDFCYWRGGQVPAYTNYTFMTRAAYDLNSRRDFAGNASLSVVAFYQAGVGCYELRVEQEGATLSGTRVTGPNGTQRLTLYRWRYDAKKGGMTATQLYTRAVSNGSALTTQGETGNYGMLFISAVSTAKSGGVTKIAAGISRECRALNTWTTSGSVPASWVWYDDEDDTLRLKAGTYGVLSANCPGRFVYPVVYENRAVAHPTSTAKSGYNDNSTLTFPSDSALKICVAELENEEWAIQPWRMSFFNKSTTNIGLLSDPFAQPLNIYTAAPGSTDWTLVATTNITSYGSMDKPIVFNFWSKNDCSVRVAPGGDDDTARTDIVIDDFEIRQWRGESYDGIEGAKYFENIGYGSPTNFVFTQGWIVTNRYGVTNCQLNARRAYANSAASIRSPLMDGIEGRGTGLGMLTFTYANAQPNVNLLVQVATNGVDITSLPTLSESVAASDWTTVTNFSFAALSAAELAEGKRSVYLGLHGVTGVMRLVMDPKVVAAVESETDPAKFASIDITGVLCRDEPALDEKSWWGWNLRTTDDAEFMSLGDVAARGVEDGMALGLNDSISRDTREPDASQYAKHFPFVQSPLFALPVVGEVSFKARKYALTDPSARITLYGANGVTVPDEDWKRITSWTVTNATYAAFSYKTAPGENYRAFRFSVTGVEGVIDPAMPDPEPLRPAHRVLIDDLMVLEAVRTRVGFKNVAAFRTGLDTREALVDITSPAQQPLCKEAWGVQAEIFATQLAEEVDLSTAKVRLWWHEGLQPWGFDNWKAGAQNAWLVPCEGAPNVFRSTYYGAQGAVLPAQPRPTTVQYMLEVVYRTTKGEVTTNWLEKTDWPTPTWYSPVDYNVRFGGSFSAFNILDTVSPGWAWINELNIYGEMDENYENSDKPNQFVEIAAPGEADLTDWSLRFLYANSGMHAITTNEVATFGQNGLQGLKRDFKGMDEASSCVFHVIGSPHVLTSKLSKRLTVADGTLDGVWQVKTSTSATYTDGEIQRGMPLAVQLVRPSGVVAHELVAIGTNRWEYLGGDYLVSTQVDELNRDERARGGSGLFFDAGMDSAGIGTNAPWSASLGAFRNNGATPMDWTNAMGMTPGRLNEYQEISGRPPKPLGTSFVVYSTIEGDHLVQTFADGVLTNVTVAAVVPKGATTNITYFADRWYQVGTILTNGVVLAQPAPGTRAFVLTVGGEGVSNDFTVVARAAVDSNLETTYGLGPDNRYRAAVLNWLEGGRTKRGAFANTGDGLVGLAEYHDWSDNFVTNLDLTTMYWLDMDPTQNDGDLWLKGQISAPTPVAAGPWTNVKLTMNMMITNTATDTAWAPYILQGMDPGVTSWDYAKPEARWTWTNVTFKATGLLVNTLSGNFDRDNFMPLRWFVFAGTAGGVSTSFDANFASVIELEDPHSPDSPGSAYHWDKYPGCDVWYRWDLDNRLVPNGVEVLKPENLLK